MTDRQTLMKLGLRNTDLADIRYVKREYQESIEEIETVYEKEGREFELPSIDYKMVRERLETRGLHHKEARQYVHNLLQDYMQELNTIWTEGHTSAYIEAYQQISDYYNMTIEEFTSMPYGERVRYLADAIKELTGSYADNSDEGYLLAEFNMLMGYEENNE